MLRNATLGGARGTWPPAGPAPTPATTNTMYNTVLAGAKKVLALLLAAAVALSLGLVGSQPAAADTAPRIRQPRHTRDRIRRRPAHRPDQRRRLGPGRSSATQCSSAAISPSARPAGAAAGHREVVPRNNILAYNLTTGELLSSFTPSFNGEVDSPGGVPGRLAAVRRRRIHRLNGSTVWRAVALNPTTGALNTSFLPTHVRLGARDRRDQPPRCTSAACSAPSAPSARDKLAAVSASNGALLPTGHPAPPAAGSTHSRSPRTAQDGGRRGLHHPQRLQQPRLRPGHGGHGHRRPMPLPINTVVRNGGTNGSITSARHATATTSTAPATPSAAGSTLEGTFSVKWSDDCHQLGRGLPRRHLLASCPGADAVYIAGHPHYCGNIGGFPQTEPWQFTAAWPSARRPPAPDHARAVRLHQLRRASRHRRC